MRAQGWLLIPFVFVVGCGSKSTVSLSAHLEKPELTIEQVTLGTRLTGTFDLRLEVGSEASGGTSVSLESLGLVRASDQSSLVSPLSAAPQGAQFPVEVPKGQTKVVPFLLDDQKLLDEALRDSICAEPVQVVGTVRDTLSGGETTPLRSVSVTPSGC